ncbi:LysR family transcriptional regulator [Hahella sp. CCB-MM4]|uniref:LysR family transcriptional regulator n=1 Tax=Hahella sp. (strain CCB-MM4) TaxID=1926491 RepID=UPI000B9BE537|nr:LysR family transcriptional regulator [Hahella sp. CCB-MM4]OZG70773.1 LysR family transcriptional regulator [Hahella sp. CCB-MM4]
MLDELKIFIITAEEGSLTAAAARLNMTVATVSRRISSLEEHLKCRLLHRSPRGLSMTQEGQTYFNECAEFIRSLDQRMDSLNDTLNSLSGPLRVLAPTNLAVGPLDAFWQQFIRQYPEIELSVELSNDFIDIKQAQADIAIRIGQLPDSTLVQKFLGHINTILVSAPPDRNGRPLPESINDLENWPTVATHVLNHWELAHEDGSKTVLKKPHHYISNDLSLVINIVKAGGGITLMPVSAVYEDLQAGNLVRVMPKWQGQDRHFSLVWPYRRAVSVRTKAFMTSLSGYLHSKPWFHD